MRPCTSAATCLDADVDSQDGFWQWAHDATAARAADEGWTDDDWVAAGLQASLLSFKSDHDSAEIYGHRYCPTLPEDHMHNAPWNDWTPPSKSRERFQEALANRRPEPLPKAYAQKLGLYMYIFIAPDASDYISGDSYV